MTAFSDYLENNLGDHSLGTASFTMPSTIYLALFTTSPGDDGSGTEVSGGSYSRQTITFGAFASGSASNNVDVLFQSMPGVTVSHWGIYDASSGGNLLYHDAFDSSTTVDSGDSCEVQSGDLTITLS